MISKEVVVGLTNLLGKRPFPEEFGMRVTPGMRIGKSYGSKMSILPINQENEKKWRSTVQQRKQVFQLHNQTPLICKCLFSYLVRSVLLGLRQQPHPQPA